MHRSILFLPAFILLVLFSVNLANADVLVEDANVNTDSDEGGLTSGAIDTGSGESGDFELIACGIISDGSNPFNAPSPGSWNEIFNSTCFQPDCQIGVWGRFTDSQNSEVVTCSWGTASQEFSAGSIRYSNVDRDNPIIDSGCTEIVGENLVMPSISSEPGAQEVVLQLLVIAGNPSPQRSVEFDEFSAQFFGVLPTGGEMAFLMTGSSDIDVNGDGFEGFSNPSSEIGIGFKLCVVTLRMEPVVINVPTMSEWGLIAFAAFAGIAGFWFLRRRQVTA